MCWVSKLAVRPHSASQISRLELGLKREEDRTSYEMACCPFWGCWNADPLMGLKLEQVNQSISQVR